MPPPDDGIPVAIAPIGWSSQADNSQTSDSNVAAEASRRTLVSLARLLSRHDRGRMETNGRAKVRRLNRLEYENALRDVLDAPWLQISHMLPEDGVDHLFNKSGDRLDVSHVQLTRYLETAERAIRLAVDAAAHKSKTRRFYAREEPTTRKIPGTEHLPDDSGDTRHNLNDNFKKKSSDKI